MFLSGDLLAYAECRRRQFKVLVNLFQKVMGEAVGEGKALTLQGKLPIYLV